MMEVANERAISFFLLISCWGLHMCSIDQAGSGVFYKSMFTHVTLFQPCLVAFRNIWLLTVTGRQLLHWKYFSVSPETENFWFNPVWTGKYLFT